MVSFRVQNLGSFTETTKAFFGASICGPFSEHDYDEICIKPYKNVHNVKIFLIQRIIFSWEASIIEN